MAAEPGPSTTVLVIATAGLILMIGGVSLGLDAYAPAPARPAQPVLNWTLRFLVDPAGPSPPLWYPGGSCMSLPPSLPDGSNVSCEFYWSGEHCTPTVGFPAACSTIVGAIVAPPYSWDNPPGPTLYCPSGGCGVLELTVHAPPSGPVEPLVGTLLFGAYYHT